MMAQLPFYRQVPPPFLVEASQVEARYLLQASLPEHRVPDGKKCFYPHCNKGVKGICYSRSCFKAGCSPLLWITYENKKSGISWGDMMA